MINSRKRSTTAIVDGRFFTGESVVADQALMISGEMIVGFASASDVPSDAHVIDARGCRVAPGLIDLQVNGSGAHNASTITTVREVLQLGQDLARTGTTRWAPTILSRSVDVSSAFAALVGDSRNAGGQGTPTDLPAGRDAMTGETGVIALHIEGPWLNPEKAGAHTLSRLRGPTEDDIAAVERIAKSLPVIVTLAPECVPDPLLRRLTADSNIRVMLAHSTADYDAMVRFLDDGGAGITHVFNTMHGIGSRAPGPIPALVARPGKWASIIADGAHVHPATIALLTRAVDPGALFLVSDLIWEEFLDQSARDRILAGSRLSLLEMVAFCVASVGLPLEEALRMASLYPARFLGLDGRFGKLMPGFVADLIGFDEDFRVRFVVKAGSLA